MIDPAVRDLEALEVLLSAIELGSLTRAAQRHGVSQPSVSARIRGLESRLGFVVLERGPNGCRPTPQGQAVAQWATVLMSSAERMAVALRALRTDGRAGLRVAASLTIAEHLLPQWLARWDDRGLRGIEVTVENSTRVASSVLAGQVDVGFVEGPTVPGSVRSEVVATDELVLVVGRDHPWRRRRAPVGPRLLARTPLVLREAESGTRRALEAALAQAGSALTPPSMVFTSTTAICAVVSAGAGQAVVSDLAVVDEVAAGRLFRVPVVDLDLTRSLRAIWRSGPAPRAVTALRRSPLRRADAVAR